MGFYSILDVIKKSNFMFAIEKKEKTSQYKGVNWYKHRKKWCARLHIKGEEPKYGGTFTDEVDAAKRVNQLCEEFGIPLKNPSIVEMPTQESPVNIFFTYLSVIK